MVASRGVLTAMDEQIIHIKRRNKMNDPIPDKYIVMDWEYTERFKDFCRNQGIDWRDAIEAVGLDLDDLRLSQVWLLDIGIRLIKQCPQPPRDPERPYWVLSEWKPYNEKIVSGSAQNVAAVQPTKKEPQ